MHYQLYSKILLVLLASVFTSCSGVYRDPPKNPALTADLRNSSKTWSLYRWEHFSVEMIDDLAVSYALSWSSKTRVMRLIAGKHQIVVSATFNRGFMMSGPFSARSDLIAEIKAGHSYHLVGRVEGSLVKFWIEDDLTHEVVSNVASEKYGVMSMGASYPVYIPIVT